MLTFPTSPLPANLQKIKGWGEQVTQYDSGAQQADSPYVRPLYNWQITIDVMDVTKESPLSIFVNSNRGMTRPFLFKDPYDFRVNSTMAVRSGITNAATLYFYDTSSFQLRPDSSFVGSLFSALSGFVTLGVEYGVDQDSGIVTVNTKDVVDVWGVRSLQYFRKARFMTQYTETTPLWNVFGSVLTIQEIP